MTGSVRGGKKWVWRAGATERWEGGGGKLCAAQTKCQCQAASAVGCLARRRHISPTNPSPALVTRCNIFNKSKWIRAFLFPRSYPTASETRFQQACPVTHYTLAMPNRWSASSDVCQYAASHKRDRNGRFCVQPS